MDIREIKEMKASLREEIRMKIVKFEEETGVQVDELYLERISINEMTAPGKTILAEVTIHCKI